jgi:DNA-binding MarR family transcriptional regulator
MTHTTSCVAELLKSASSIYTTHLPLEGSLVAYELLLSLYSNHVKRQQATIKELFAGIPYSDMGIRYHLTKLVDNGWVELQASTKDRRTKTCVPTVKLIEAWETVVSKIQDSLETRLESELVCRHCGGEL